MKVTINYNFIAFKAEEVIKGIMKKVRIIVDSSVEIGQDVCHLLQVFGALKQLQLPCRL